MRAPGGPCGAAAPGYGSGGGGLTRSCWRYPDDRRLDWPQEIQHLNQQEAVDRGLHPLYPFFLSYLVLGALKKTGVE